MQEALSFMYNRGPIIGWAVSGAVERTLRGDEQTTAITSKW